MKGILFFLFFGLIVSCHPSKTYTSGGAIKNCSTYYQYVKKNWTANEQGIFHFTQSPSYDTSLNETYQFVNKPCLLGLNKKQITGLFGDPSEEAASTTYTFEKAAQQNKVRVAHPITQYHYYMKEACLQKAEHKPGCAQLTFSFGVEDEVVAVYLPIEERELKY